MKLLMQLASAACLIGTALHATAGNGPEPKVAFITSVTGGVVLGDWPDADDQTGLAAADRICQNRAAAAGLANASTFVAWLSDSSNDAYCRIQGLTGRKADNCGQASLPSNAGPWVRTDGYPFGPELANLLNPNNVVYAPPVLDEFGNSSGATRRLLTATDYDGTAYGSDCGNWTDDTLSGLRVGRSGAVNGGWTRSSGTSCALSGASLLCMEPSSGPALPPFQSSGRLAFLSSVSGTGNLGSWPEAGGATGLAAGDAICQTLAENAGLANPSSFRAWLSDDSTDAVDRFDDDGPWVRPDGVPVAANLAELTSAAWFTGLAQDENGQYLTEDDGANVWSATRENGTVRTPTCQNWTDGTNQSGGRRGLYFLVDGWRSDFSNISCSLEARLFCLTRAGELFSDRFEF